MKRRDARKGTTVRVRVRERERIGTISELGDHRLPGLRNAARVILRDHPEVGAVWAPIEELEEVKQR